MTGCDDLIVIHQVIPWNSQPMSRTWLHWLAHVFSECSRRCEAEHWSTDWMGDLMEEFMAHVNNVSTQIPCICTITSNSSFLSPNFGRFWPLAGDNPPILGSDWSGQGSRPLRAVIPGCCRSLLLPNSHTCIWNHLKMLQILGAIIWKHIESTDTLNSMEAIVD